MASATPTGRPLPRSIDDTLALLEAGDYVADRSLATALFLALKLRPAAVPRRRGRRRQDRDRQGAGRRRWAGALIRLQCYEGLDVASAVYEWNYARQMIEIRLAEAAGRRRPRRRSASDIFAERFLIRRPLLQALEPDTAGAPVLLIDELDRTDEPFEAYLLEVLSDFQVTIPELGTIKAAQPPIVDHHLEPHARDPRRAEAPLLLPLGRLSRRRARARDPAGQGAGRRRAPVAPGRRLRAGAAQAWTCSSCRASPRRSTGRRRWSQLDALASIPQTIDDTLGVLLKYQDDIAKSQGSEAAEILRKVKSDIAAEPLG